MEDKIRLIKNLAVLAVIGLLGYAVFWYFTSDDNEELVIDETPIHIESIKTIAEITTISYRDEVVMDSVEYHKGSVNAYDPRNWQSIYERAVNGSVKRRLTIIVKGEVRYGLDLTDGKNYSLTQNPDTAWLVLPQPTILDVIVTPSKTEIFQEQGTWRDKARKMLELRGKNQLKENALALNLEEKARENAESIFSKMIRTDKKLIIRFE